DVLIDRARHLLPGRTQLLAALLNERTPGVCKDERPTVAGFLRSDQTLVLELGKRRIHRAWARPPDTVRTLLDLLHDLVAVQRPIAQQQERSCPDVATASPRPTREPGLTEERPETSPPSERPVATTPTAHREQRTSRRHP